MKKPLTNGRSHRSLFGIAAMIMPAFAFGADGQQSYFTNPLFNTLLIAIVVLLVIILGLANALRAFIGSDAYAAKLRRDKERAANKTFGILALMTVTSTLEAANVSAAEPVRNIGGVDYTTFYTMTAVIAVEVIVTGILIRTFRLMTDKPQAAPAPAVAKKPLLDKLNKTVAIEDEASITLDHVYDGIRELDNDLPPWWKYGFYLTIAVAVVYMIMYHVTQTLPLQAEEYRTSVRKGNEEVASYMKQSANNVDETTVKLLTEPADLQAGRDIFIASCAACHGRAGEGGVGPNLTDDYWLHQGGVSDVFKTIKYGWPDKGMKAWKEDFSPMQIAQLTSFIKSLRGTNPPNGKDKQGELYAENAAPADTSSAPTAQATQ